MRKGFLRSVSAALAMVLCCASSTISAAALTPNLSIVSDAYVVVDAASGQVLIEKNMTKQRAPASITKIMTLALAFEKGGRYDENITVSKAATQILPGSTHIALEVGEQITFKDAVMATQLISANDAANVVAEYVSGSMDAFVAGMNAKVQELGLSNTHFANPNGLDANGHYVTAYDMAQITRYALSVPGFREVFAATEYQMPVTNKKARNYQFLAQNAIVFPQNREYYEGITGSKLGYTGDAQHTLVASAKRGDMELIVVTLGSRSSSGKYTDAKLLLDYCFERYQTMTLSGKDIRVGEVPVASRENPTATVSFSSDDHSFVVPLGTAKSSLEIRYDVPELFKSERRIEASFSVYTADGQLVCTAPLDYQINSVERMAQSPAGLGIPKPRSDYFNQIVVVAFKCLLVALAVFTLLFIVCRTLVMTRYMINKRRAYNRRLEKLKRRELALQRSAAEIAQLEKELGMRLPSIHRNIARVPNNVTHIYPNRTQSPPPSARSASSRK